MGSMHLYILLIGLYISGGSSLVRVKRGSGPETVPLTEAQKIEIVKIHDDLRTLSGSSNMRYMTWDSELAWIAEEYGQKCQYKHNPNRKHSNLPSVGENIYASTAEVSSFVASKAVQLWYDEVSDFDYNTRTCTPGAMCGHYTQIVWATTYKVGCSLTVCDFLSEINWKKAVLFICNYATAGNIVSGRDRKLLQVFEKGPSCSKCGKGDYCRMGLCANSERDFVDEPSKPPPDTSESSNTGLIVGVVILGVLVLLLVVIIVFRERVKPSARFGLWRKETPNNPTRFSNQNTPVPSRLNTPRHSLVAGSLHGMQRLTAADIGHPVAKIKEGEKIHSASAPTTPRKGYTKGTRTPPRQPPPVPPPPLIKHCEKNLPVQIQ